MINVTWSSWDSLICLLYILLFNCLNLIYTLLLKSCLSLNSWSSSCLNLFASSTFVDLRIILLKSCSDFSQLLLKYLAWISYSTFTQISCLDLTQLSYSDFAQLSCSVILLSYLTQVLLSYLTQISCSDLAQLSCLNILLRSCSVILLEYFAYVLLRSCLDLLALSILVEICLLRSYVAFTVLNMLTLKLDIFLNSRIEK